MAAWENDVQEILKEGKKEVSALGKALLKVLDGGKAVDLALFGRMLANMPEKNQNCVFRSNSGSHSGAIRAPVPLQIRQAFRTNSGTL